MFLLDLFGGVSSLRAGALAAGYQIVGHIHVENNGAAKKVVEARYSSAKLMDDIRPLAQKASEFAKCTWEAIRQSGADFVLPGCGFPCRELSKVNLNRRGLDH